MRLVYWSAIALASGALQAQTGNPVPVINPGGVITAQQFGAFTTIAPGTWIEIYGTNLSATTRAWRASDFLGNTAPTVLDNVRIMIGSQFAFLDYVSPGQVNAQVPNAIGTGTVNLTVITATGTSAPYPLTVSPSGVQPETYAPPTFKIGGKQYVGAVFPDGAYALPAGANAGVTSRPAKPGDIVTLYGIGFGPTVPDVPPGQIAQGETKFDSLRIVFANSNADIKYAGFAPGFVGLYQFNIVVPDLPNNDLVPVSLLVNGLPDGQVLYIPIQH